jgi:predicted kinase
MTTTSRLRAGPAEAVIFCGIQGSGKTTFYTQRLLATHVRISLDLLRTRHRERVLMEACLAAGQPFAVDNTNPTRAHRARYVEPARAAGFRVSCLFFDARPREAIARNEARHERERIPVAGVLGTYKRLERPSLQEGFGEIARVTIAPDGRLVVQPLEAPASRPG